MLMVAVGPDEPWANELVMGIATVAAVVTDKLAASKAAARPGDREDLRDVRVTY